VLSTTLIFAQNPDFSTIKHHPKAPPFGPIIALK
jgi:hypothetical protein